MCFLKKHMLLIEKHNRLTVQWQLLLTDYLASNISAFCIQFLMFCVTIFVYLFINDKFQGIIPCLFSFLAKHFRLLWLIKYDILSCCYEVYS